MARAGAREGARDQEDRRLEDREQKIFFLVWWEGHSLRESTWEPAAGIHPVQQRVFFQAAGVLD
jgi:hypothetical protein